MREADVLIAGAGPAGTTCALLLQRQGHDTLVVDPASFPRDKVCGGGLTPPAWKLLEELFPDFRYDYLPVREMALYMGRKYRGTYSLLHEIRVVQRRLFDNALLEKYRSGGGAFLQERLVDVRELPDGTVEATLFSGERIRCRYLVGADGASSRVRRYLNPDSRADTLILEQYQPRSGKDIISIDLGREYDNGYFYIFPNTGFDAVGYVERHTVPDKLSSLVHAFGLEESRCRGALISTAVDYPAHERILLTGDAGCWCDCLSYEGIYYAIVTGRNAAEAILSGRPFSETNLAVAEKKRRRIKAARLLYNPVGLAMVKLISRNRRMTERILNRYLRP